MTEPFVVTLAPERARDGHQTYEVTKAGMGRMGYQSPMSLIRFQDSDVMWGA